MKFEDHRETASEVGEESGEFYNVKAECVMQKFSAQRASVTLDQPSRPRPPRSPTASPSGGSTQKFSASLFIDHMVASLTETLCNFKNKYAPFSLHHDLFVKKDYCEGTSHFGGITLME